MVANVFRPLSTLHGNTYTRNLVMSSRARMEVAAQELATGFRSDVARDLGMRSSESYELRSLMAKNERFVVNNNGTQNKLDVVASAMDEVREEIQGVLNLAISNEFSATDTAKTLQVEAEAAIQRIVSYLNVNVNGEFVFSGIDTDQKALTGYDEVNGATGFSPRGVVDGVTGGTIASAADAATKIAELQGIFDSSNGVVPTRNFEDTFYNGTDLAVGVRKSALIDDDTNLEYGVQANDPAFTDALQGLSMLVSVDVDSIADQAGYQAYMGEVLTKLSGSVDQIIETQAKLGKQQETLENITIRIEDENDIYNNRVLALESVDPFIAASRLSSLETQLDASYAATARLTKLSFLNFMR